MRKNCISDIPAVSYYIPAGSDKDGLALYKCLRGTDALEGLHQKLRQLVRGFSNTPRFMLALLGIFFVRWNQNIEITTRGLDKHYDGMCRGKFLEEIIEKVLQWKERGDSSIHHEWECANNTPSTNEMFGITDSMSSMSLAEGISPSESNEILDENADAAAQ